MQRDELIVTRPEQARALQDTGFLARFLEPASPSDVARSLGIPANLATITPGGIPSWACWRR
jgi:hypothetical protein